MPQADRPTQMLMNYLVSQYGQKTLSGLQHNSSENLAFPVSQYLSQSGGVMPAIRGSDLIDYSPSRVAFGANPRNETEADDRLGQADGRHRDRDVALERTGEFGEYALRQQLRRERLAWWRGFYTQGTTFNLAAALANPAGSDYQLLLRDIDAIAVQLQKYEDAGVPVIWRPLHEAQGNEPDGDLVLVGRPRPGELQSAVEIDARPAHQASRAAQSDLGIHIHPRRRRGIWIGIRATTWST